MLEKIIWFLKNFSGIRFGWWDTQMANQGGMNQILEGISIMCIIFMGIVLILNIINYWVNIEFSRGSILILILYLISNTFIMILVTLMGLTIGGFVGFIILGLIFLIGSIVEMAVEGETVAGMFGLLGYAKDTADDYNQWKKKMKEWKKLYNSKRLKT